ncbi:MAG: hypothetical protein A2V66_17025 [Ignavibacteria bacterium RBG_13_36_8]|nr:MAG: hypothetical protein A2V66_17025 [Ignavibacteria bacterium RBG_13_36_8]
MIMADEGFSGEVDLLVRVTDPEGAYAEKTIRVTVEAAVGIEDLEIPTDYILYQNYPNPFNPSTTIRYGLPWESRVTVVIYNMLGQQVAILVNEVRNVGYHEAIWNAGNFTSGIYLYMIRAQALNGSGQTQIVRKMILVK